MAKNKGQKSLTWIQETACGFVGNRPLPEYGKTTAGKSRVVFIIACNKQDEARNKLTIWRLCVAYGDLAEQIKDVKVGDLVKAQGSLYKEYKLDDYYKPLLDEHNNKIPIETLVLYKAEIRNYEKRQVLQPALIGS